MPGAVEVIMRTEGDRIFVYKVYVKGEPRPRGLTHGVEISSDFESWDPAAAWNKFNFMYDSSLKG